MSDKHIKDIITSGTEVGEGHHIGIKFSVVNADGAKVSVYCGKHHLQDIPIFDKKTRIRLSIDQRLELSQHAPIYIYVDMDGKTVEQKSLGFLVIPASQYYSKRVLGMGANLEDLRRNLATITCMALTARVNAVNSVEKPKEVAVLDFETPTMSYKVSITRKTKACMLNFALKDDLGDEFLLTTPLKGWLYTVDQILSCLDKKPYLKLAMDLALESTTKSLMQLKDDDLYSASFTDALFTVIRHSK
ncbi:hypothetical protein [Vibrio phage phiKT1019]|nr:hypothetical protein [Vibrio phage phiKT1019]